MPTVNCKTQEMYDSRIVHHVRAQMHVTYGVILLTTCVGYWVSSIMNDHTHVQTMTNSTIKMFM